MSHELSFIRFDAARLTEFMRAAYLADGEQPGAASDLYTVSTTDDHALIRMDWHDGMLREKDYERLSRVTPVLTLDVTEVGNYSSCRQWEDGEEIWSLTFDGDAEDGLKSSYHRDTCPAELEAAFDEVMDPDRDPDDFAKAAFLAPPSLFRKLTGTDYTAPISGDARPLIRTDIVVKAKPAAAKTSPAATKPWWRFW